MDTATDGQVNETSSPAAPSSWSPDERHRRECFDCLDRDLGVRFRHATLKSIEVYHANQKPVLTRLWEIAGEIETYVRGGNGLILHGPVGTGKTHMATSLLRTAAHRGIRTRYLDAMAFYTEVGDTLKTRWTKTDVMRPFAYAELLLIDDPAPAVGLSDERARILEELVRVRYTAGKPTWITSNFADEDQAMAMLGAQVWSRLAERAEIIRCAWPDYRRRAKG